MNTHDEILQRCFDDDLNDDEMKSLFTLLSKNKVLREEYKAMHALRNEFRSGESYRVPAHLDDRVNDMIASHRRTFIRNAAPVKRFFARRLSFSVPAFAALIVLMLAGSYVAAATWFKPARLTEYVYVVEMPAYVVQSTVYTTTNN